jgi:hypothetical protein
LASASRANTVAGRTNGVAVGDGRPRYGFWKFSPAPLYWTNCAQGTALIATCDAVPAPFWNWS